MRVEYNLSKNEKYQIIFSFSHFKITQNKKLHNINIIMLLILLHCQRINKNYFFGFLF